MSTVLSVRGGGARLLGDAVGASEGADVVENRTAVIRRRFDGCAVIDGCAGIDSGSSAPPARWYRAVRSPNPIHASPPSQAELADAIAEATRAAVTDLFSRHPGSYYYVALITTGEAHAPFLTAWSREALAERAVETEAERTMLKWSHADSPYALYGEELFARVRELFALRPEMGVEMSEQDWEDEYELRLGAMEIALRRVDQKGLFGTGDDRLAIVVNAEVMPPDHSNTERARRLNPAGALKAYLDDASE